MHCYNFVLGGGIRTPPKGTRQQKLKEQASLRINGQRSIIFLSKVFLRAGRESYRAKAAGQGSRICSISLGTTVGQQRL